MSELALIKQSTVTEKVPFDQEETFTGSSFRPEIGCGEEENVSELYG